MENGLCVDTINILFVDGELGFHDDNDGIFARVREDGGQRFTDVFPVDAKLGTVGKWPALSSHGLSAPKNDQCSQEEEGKSRHGVSLRQFIPLLST